MNVNNRLVNLLNGSILVNRQATNQTAEAEELDFINKAVESTVQCRNSTRKLKAIIEKVDLKYGCSTEKKDFFIASVLSDERSFFNRDDIFTTILECFDKVVLTEERYPNVAKSHSHPIKIEIAKLNIRRNLRCFSQNIRNYDFQDQAALIKLAKLAAQKGDDIYLHIQNYGIQDPMALFEIAKIAAQQNAIVSQHIQKFGITDQSDLIEIAKIAASVPGNKVSQYIQNYGIKDQAALIEIAKIAASVTENNVSQYIQHYGIKDQVVLLEIAKLVAQRQESFIFQLLHNYGFENPADIIEIAMLVAQIRGINIQELADQAILIELAKMDARSSAYLIPKNYGIKDQSSLIEIAMLVAQQSSNNVSEHIQDYGIKDQTVLIQLARLAATKSGENTSQYIQNYGFTDQAILIELAMLTAQSGYDISKYIQNYGIQSQTALIQIAKTAAKCCSMPFGEHLKNFGIQDQTALIEIIKIAIQRRWNNVTRYFGRYDIKDQATLIEIAKFAAQKGSISQYIQNYGIKDQAALIDIAQIAVRRGDSCGIHNYGITDQAILIELAKLAAQQGSGFYQDIHNLGITDQTALIEIARMAIQSRSEISAYIRNFGITDQAALIELAKMVLPLNVRDFAINIGNYGITDQAILIELAKLAAQQGIGFYQYIQYFTITDQAALAEIAKIAAQHETQFSESISDYKIKSPVRRLEIFIEAFIRDLDALYSIDAYDLPKDANYQVFLGNLKVLCNEYALKPQEIIKVTESMIRFFADHQMPEIVGLLEKAKEQTDPFLLRPVLIWLNCFLSMSHANDIHPTELSPEIYALLQLRNPNLRYSLTRELFACVVQPEKLQKLKNFRQGMRKHAILSTCYLFLLKQKGLHDAEQMAKKIQNKAISSNLLFKEAYVHLGLLETLDIFCKDPSLSIERKENFLKIVVNSESKKEILEIFTTIKCILQLNGDLACLKNADNKQMLKEKFHKAFHQEFPMKTVPDFSIKFGKTLDSFRDKTAIFTYAASLAQFGRRGRLCKLFSTFMYDVLENKFTTTRYEASEHLDKVFASQSGLCDLWKQGQKSPFQEMTAEPSTQKKVDLAALLKRSFYEGHVCSKDLPRLYAYLTTSNSEGRRSILEQTSKMLGNEKLTEHQKKLYEFQTHLMAFIEEQDPKAALVKLSAALKKSPFDSSHQFYHDLQGLLKNLQQKESIQKVNPYFDYVLVDSDDPCDLLLSGTEVEGSCQRINGDPELNKCLLAYLIDGKNRLLAIKDEKGVIKARAILRLLWDEKNRKPVLFMERVYPHILHPKLLDALVQFAKVRASILNLQLTSIEVGAGKPYASVLQSLGSKAPYEYVDALNGINIDSKWSISEAFVLE